jgi:hypothetical protein
MGFYCSFGEFGIKSMTAVHQTKRKKKTKTKNQEKDPREWKGRDVIIDQYMIQL